MFGPLAKSQTCASVSGLLNNFFTHLTMAGSGADVHGNTDGKLLVVTVVVIVAGVANTEVEVMLDGIWFEQLLELAYMYPHSLLLLFIPQPVKLG